MKLYNILQRWFTIGQCFCFYFNQGKNYVIEKEEWTFENEVCAQCISNQIVACKKTYDMAIYDLVQHSNRVWNYTEIKQRYTKFTNCLAPTTEIEKKFHRFSNVLDSSAFDAILSSSNNYYDKMNLSDVKLLLLCSHYKEDLSWLDSIQVPYIIASKTIRRKSLHVKWNVGNEVSSYFLFIIKYYDLLPEITLFLHGHNKDWHQFYPVKFIVQNVDLQSRGYRNVNNVWLNWTTDVWLNRGILEKRKRFWNHLSKQRSLDDLPSLLQDKCCGQFHVHRDRIRLNPKIFYQNILDYVLEYDSIVENDSDGYHTPMSYVLETMWHFIFGEPAIVDTQSYLDSSSLIGFENVWDGRNYKIYF